MYGCTDEWMNEWTDEWINGLGLDEWTMDGWIDRQTNGYKSLTHKDY